MAELKRNKWTIEIPAEQGAKVAEVGYQWDSKTAYCFYVYMFQ